MKECEIITEARVHQEQEITHFTLGTTQNNLVYLFDDFKIGALKHDRLKPIDYKFVIFDFNKKHKWSPVYKCLLEKSYFFQKKAQYTLTIDESYPMHLALEDQIFILDDDDYDILILLPTFIKWVKMKNQNKLPLNNSPELQNFFHDHYKKKMVNSGYLPDKKLNPTIACVICQNQIVGFAASIYNKGFDYSISANNIHHYISRVEIIDEFQNKGLCTPLLTYLLDYLIFIKNIKSIYIDNLSDTDSGIAPGVSACLCYLRSGHHNGFQVYLDSENGIKPIRDEFCVDGKSHDDESYIYMR